MAKVDTYPAFTASGVKVTSSVGDAAAGVNFEWPNGTAAFVAVPEQGMYLDACDFQGQPVAIVSGHDTDTAYLVRMTGVEPLAKTHGMRAVAINVVAGVLRWVFVHNTTQYVDTGEVKPLPPDQIQTSQGILALEPDGRINWAAPPDRREPAGGVLLYHKVNAGAASAGLLAAEDQCTVVDTDPHTLALGLVHQIRIVERTDGLFGVCGRAQNGQALFWVGPPWPDFIEPSDPLPPVESVPLLNRPFGLVAYCFNNAETVGNLQLPIRPTVLVLGKHPIVATGDDEHNVSDVDLWACYSGESATVPAETAIQQARLVGNSRERGLLIAQDSEPMRPTVMALSQAPDVLSPRCYRNQGETTSHYKARLELEYARVSNHAPDGVECYPTINVHQRFIGPDPTLSVKDVIEGFVAACQLAESQDWPGMVLFRIGTADCPIAALRPYLVRFMSGITGTPEALYAFEDPEIPEETDGMNVYLLVTPAAAPKPNKVPPPGTTELLGARENQSDGSFGIKKPNGKYATLNPSGNWEERDAVLGHWEKFYDGKPGFVLAPRHDDSGQRCFTLEAVQGP